MKKTSQFLRSKKKNEGLTLGERASKQNVNASAETASADPQRDERAVPYDIPEAPPEPPDPREFAPSFSEDATANATGVRADVSAPYASGVKRALDAQNVSAAEEGEFLHQKASAANGLELLGKVARYLRKKKTPASDRAFELLSRGVAVKERGDAAAFVAPDSCFLSMCEPSVVAELGEAVVAAGIKKRVRIEKTDDDLYAEDLARARELFGRDGVTPRAK